MLQALWYSLVLLLQVAQTDPATRWDQLSFDVFVDSAPVWTLEVKGNARGGTLMADGVAVGIYDASERVSQAYLIAPMVVPPGLEDTANGDSGSTGSSAKVPAPAPSPAGKDIPPPVFALDFGPAVKALLTLGNPGTLSLVPDLPLPADGASTGGPKAGSPAPAAKSPAPGTSADPRASPAGTDGEDSLQIRRTPGRTVLSWASRGIVVVMTRR